MKILFISPYNTSGGAERVMTTLANEFSNMHDVTFVTFDSKSSFYPLKENINQIRMGLVSNKGRMKLFTIGLLEIKRYRQLVDIFKKVKPDIVVSFLFMPNILGILAAQKCNIPIVISERNDPTKYGKMKKLVMNTFYRKANGIVCQSKHIQAMANKDYGITNNCVIPNPINASQYINEFVQHKQPKIVSVGRLIPQKNHMLTIKAFKKVCDKYPNYNLYIYGEGPLRSVLEDKVKELGLSKRVFLPGVESEVMKKNADATLYVMSSNFEGYPNALVEAMANGVLSITTDFPSQSARDIIFNEENGFLIKTGDLNSLAALMDNILGNPNAYISTARRGKEITKIIGVNTVLRQWESFLQQVLEEKNEE